MRLSCRRENARRSIYCIYLRQANGVNGEDTVFVPLCAAALNANSSKTVKAVDFKFDMHVPRDSPDMTLKIFRKGCQTVVT